MSWLILIIVGAIVGWLANMIVRPNLDQGLVVDIIIGIIGSFLGRLIFFDWLGIGSAASAGTLSFYGILWGVIGAVVLIAILRLFRAY